MARNTYVHQLSSSTWTELTNADCTKASMTWLSGNQAGVILVVTTTATPPAASDLGHVFRPTDPPLHGRLLTDLNPAVVGKRVFARTLTGSAAVVWSDDSL
jgi:hypothetical protein